MNEDFDVNNFIAIDCEYVSIANRFYAWQIGIHKFVNGQMVTKWTSYVKPPRKPFDTLNEKKQKILDLYESALNHFYKREWVECIAVTDEILKLEHDGPTVHLKKRAEYYRTNPPAAEWQGEYVRQAKR